MSTVIRTFAKAFGPTTIYLYDGEVRTNPNRAQQQFGPSMQKGSVRLLHADGRIEHGHVNMPGGIYTDVTGLDTYEAIRDAMLSNEALVNAQRTAQAEEAAKNKAELQKQRTEELMSTGRGWYHVEVVCFKNDHVRGGHKEATFSGQCLADNGLQAYNRAVDELHKMGAFWPEEYTTANITYLGVMTDELREAFATA